MVVMSLGKIGGVPPVSCSRATQVARRCGGSLLWRGGALAKLSLNDVWCNPSIQHSHPPTFLESSMCYALYMSVFYSMIKSVAATQRRVFLCRVMLRKHGQVISRYWTFLGLANMCKHICKQLTRSGHANLMIYNVRTDS